MTTEPDMPEAATARIGEAEQSGAITATCPCQSGATRLRPASKTTGPVPLPRTLEPVHGEALMGHITRLAARLRVPALLLLSRAGIDCYRGRSPIRLTLNPDRRTVEQLASLLRLSDDEVCAMTLQHLPGAQLRPGLSDKQTLQHATRTWTLPSYERHCSRCLHEHPGHWALLWTLPWTFVCLRHEQLLQHQPQGNGRHRAQPPDALDPSKDYRQSHAQPPAPALDERALETQQRIHSLLTTGSPTAAAELGALQSLVVLRRLSDDDPGSGAASRWTRPPSSPAEAAHRLPEALATLRAGTAAIAQLAAAAAATNPNGYNHQRSRSLRSLSSPTSPEQAARQGEPDRRTHPVPGAAVTRPLLSVLDLLPAQEQQRPLADNLDLSWRHLPQLLPEDCALVLVEHLDWPTPSGQPSTHGGCTVRSLRRHSVLTLARLLGAPHRHAVADALRTPRTVMRGAHHSVTSALRRHGLLERWDSWHRATLEALPASLALNHQVLRDAYQRLGPLPPDNWRELPGHQRLQEAVWQPAVGVHLWVDLTGGDPHLAPAMRHTTAHAAVAIGKAHRAIAVGRVRLLRAYVAQNAPRLAAACCTKRPHASEGAVGDEGGRQVQTRR